MRSYLNAIGLAALVTISPAAVQAESAVAGVTTLALSVPHRKAPLDAFVWYPAGEGGYETKVGDNPLFVGVPAKRDAEFGAGKHPLILLSHGSGGNAANLSWYATPLAKAGFIVVSVNHPGTTSGDSRPKDTVKLWERPADYTAALDALKASENVAQHIDWDRIGVAGFSLGGHTALSLAGARVDAKAFAAYCDRDDGTFQDCVWYRKGNVDLHALDAEAIGRSFRDPRVKAVAAYDPALAVAYVPESLTAMALPASIVNLGATAQAPEGVRGDKIAALMPDAAYAAVRDSTHFSFLGTCRPNGAEILKAEDETDPLCDDGGARPRGDIHAEISEAATKFFVKALK